MNPILQELLYRLLWSLDRMERSAYHGAYEDFLKNIE
jgi:hypothetical protein